MCNDEIRRQLRADNIPLWKVADALGVSEMTVSRWLRHELDEAKKEQVIQAIGKVKKEVTHE
ncbi:MAG: helix-turn-helix domain-containing protein [Lactimicrobium massiliense]